MKIKIRFQMKNKTKDYFGKVLQNIKFKKKIDFYNETKTILKLGDC